MTNHSIHTDISELFQALPMQTVPLELEQIDQAVEISDRVLTESRQWKTYLNTLALFGFQQWLSEQSPELNVDYHQSPVWQPHYANVIEAACGIKVGDFKLCLVATSELDASIQLPRATIDLPEFAAHFYVAVRILEEQEQAEIWGFLRYDQWTLHQQTEPLNAESDWNYCVPVAWFDRDPTHLLLHLRCLEPTAISLPEMPSDRLEHSATLKNTIVQKLSQHPTEALWQQLTWEQGKVILTNPSLLKWFYQLQTHQLVSRPVQPVETQPASYTQSLIQAAVNVGYWLQDELDDIARQLNWVLLPPLGAMRGEHPATPFRLLDASILQETDVIYKQLIRDGVKIPSGARCAYNDLHLANNPLRLYAVTWPIGADEWALLLILKIQSTYTTDRAIKLCVNDQTQMLVEAVLDPRTGNNSIYTRVVGAKTEQFQVLLALENSMLTLPPFMFHLDE